MVKRLFSAKLSTLAPCIDNLNKKMGIRIKMSRRKQQKTCPGKHLLFSETKKKFALKFFTVAFFVVFLLPGTFAWGLRVDVSATNPEMRLSPLPGDENKALKNASWGNESFRRRNLFYQRKGLNGGKTAKFEFRFVSSVGGNVVIHLNGCWAKRKRHSRKDKEWVEYLRVETEGATLLNGDFSERSANGKPKYWKLDAGARVMDKGVRAWNEARVSQQIKVEAGKPVIVRLLARDGGTDLASLPLPPISFRHGGWKLTVDGSDGIWKSLSWNNIPIYYNPGKLPSFILNGEKTKGDRKLVKHSFDPTAGVAKIVTNNGSWSFEERLSFGKRLKREIIATFNGREPVKFRWLKFCFYLPKTGSYYLPRSLFGDLRHYMRIADNPEYKPDYTGRLDKIKNGKYISGVKNCCFSFVQQTPSRTLMFSFDGRRDQNTATFNIHKDCVQNNIHVRAAGWAMPGRPQVFGPEYIEVFNGNIQTALRKAPRAWFRDIGMLPPANRPEWVKDISSLWVFSPTPIHGGVDGFAAAARETIPYAKKRGANVFWALPLQTIGYSIREYYKFNPDVGSAADYRKFLECAHKNGFHFWQDIVPHGHFAEYGFIRRVSPFTISIAENGQYVKKQSFDYASSEWRKYICDVAAYYAKNFPIDGFRIDQSSHSPINWRRPGFPAMAPKMSDPRYWNADDVVWWNKSLAKWWNDAVAKNGGKAPPVDGQRGSSSLCEGGVILTREIRNTVRGIRPDGAVLAETENISCVPSSDAIFDFYIRRVGLKMSLFDGETTAREFARFLDEQKFTDPPGTLRVRFLEVHDAQQQRFTNWCGEKAGRALRSAIFWSKGIPQLLASTDVGMGVLLEHLNSIRKALPEFRRGGAEYQAVGSKPSVFAVLRSLKGGSSIGISSFLPGTVNTVLDIPVEKLGFAPGSELVLYNTWTGEKLREGKLESFRKINLKIPAYGNAVLTWRPRGTACPAVPPEKQNYTIPSPRPLSLKETPDEIIVEGTKKLVIDRRSGLLKSFGNWLDGSLILDDKALPKAPAKLDAKLENGLAVITAELACGVKLRYTLKGVELKICGSVSKFSGNERIAFALSATEAKRWRVNSIEGLLDDFIDKNIIDPDLMAYLPVSFQSYRPAWSPVLWHSEIKPLNPASPKIQVFEKDRNGFEIELASPLASSYDDMLLLNKLPGRAGLHLAIFWVQPGPLSLADRKGPRSFTITIRPAQKLPPTESSTVNGIKISHESMFWHFDNGKYSLRLTRNGGAIKELKAKNGKVVLADQDIVGGQNLAKPVVKATLDLETGVRCFTENGKLKLRFLSALRNGGNNGLLTLPVWVVTDYILDGSEFITQSWKVYADTPVPIYQSRPSLMKNFQLA